MTTHGYVEAIVAIPVSPIAAALYPVDAIEAANSIQPVSTGFPCGDARRYGATGDGLTDDADAIQTAADYAIAAADAGRTVQVILPPGRFVLSKPIRLFKFKNGAYSYTSITFSGEARGYVSGKKTELLPTFNDKPAIIVQAGRNTVIRDFSIRGNANAMSLPSYAELLQDNDAPWWNTNGARDSRYSPHCGIAVDPFSATMPADGGYPGLPEYYTQTSGSTGITIERVEVQGFICGIALSTSQGTQVGDSIVIRECNLSYNKVSIAVGQSQNRGVSVVDCHVKGARLVVDCAGYGVGNAPMPNLIGGVYVFVKWFMYGVPGWGQGSLTNVYAESMWSLGFWGWNSGKFPLRIDGCHFKFIAPDDEDYPQAIDCHFHAAGPVYATGTYFGQYKNQVRRLSFRNAQMAFDGCAFDGEPNFSDAKSVRMDKCSNVYAGAGYMSYSAQYATSLAILGAANYQVQGSPFCTVESAGPLNYLRLKAQNGWDVIPVDAALLITVAEDGSAKFMTANPGRLVIGDFLTTLTSWNGEKPDPILPDKPYAWLTIGRVASISGNEVTLSEVPVSFKTGTYTPYIQRLPVIRNRTIGTTATGSTVITGVTPIAGWAAGQRITASSLPQGTYIQAVSGDTLTISQPATSSGVVELYDTRFAVDHATRNAPPTSGVWIRGDFIRYYAGGPKDQNNMLLAGWVCTVSGSPGTWEPVYWSTVSPST